MLDWVDACSCWEGFFHPNHLFESSKMFYWGLHHWFLEDVVSAGLQVDILPRLLNKELDCLMEVFFQAAIFHGQYWHSRINRLWKMLMKHLFPGCFVVALEHVFQTPQRSLTS